MNLNWGWPSASDDVAVFAVVDRFVSRSVKPAKRRGLNNRFVYINYASQEQDGISGYRKNSERRLGRLGGSMIRKTCLEGCGRYLKLD
jgi:hypothetical protein